MDQFLGNRLGGYGSRAGTGYAGSKRWAGRKIAWQENRFLIGNNVVLRELKDGVDPGTILQEMDSSLAAFHQRRERYLLYR